MFVSMVPWSPAGWRCFRTRIGRKQLGLKADKQQPLPLVNVNKLWKTIVNTISQPWGHKLLCKIDRFIIWIQTACFNSYHGFAVVWHIETEMFVTWRNVLFTIIVMVIIFLRPFLAVMGLWAAEEYALSHYCHQLPQKEDIWQVVKAVQALQKGSIDQVLALLMGGLDDRRKKRM